MQDISGENEPNSEKHTVGADIIQQITEGFSMIKNNEEMKDYLQLEEVELKFVKLMGTCSHI